MHLGLGAPESPLPASPKTSFSCPLTGAALWLSAVMATCIFCTSHSVYFLSLEVSWDREGALPCAAALPRLLAPAVQQGFKSLSLCHSTSPMCSRATGSLPCNKSKIIPLFPITSPQRLLLLSCGLTLITK